MIHPHAMGNMLEAFQKNPKTAAWSVAVFGAFVIGFILILAL